MTVLAGCRLVLADRVVDRGWLEVRHGRIAGLGEGDAPPGVRAGPGGVWARPGTTVVPGFVDLHVHGGGGRRFEEGTRHAVQAAVGLHQSHGTTTQLASIASMQPAAMVAATSALAALAADGLVAGIHVEGPFLSHLRRGAHDPAALREPDPGLLADLLRAGDGAVRMVTVAPELPGGLRLVEAVVAAGATAAVGHTDATYAVAVAAIEAGARVATHLFNGMRPFHHREPGVIGAVLEDPRVTVELINDGFHLADATSRLAHRLATSRRVAFVTDAMAAAGVGDGLYTLGDREVRVEGGRAVLADGSSLAGSSLTMDRAFRRAVVDLGFSLVDAALAASTVPAGVIGLQGDRGDLAAGKRADLVCLDDALEVQAVMVEGRWVPAGPAATTPPRPRPPAAPGDHPGALGRPWHPPQGVPVSHPDHVLAVDVGGTRIKVARVDRAGDALDLRYEPTPRPDDRPGVVERLRDLVRGEVAARAPRAVAVVVPGRVDEEGGVAREASNLGWHDVELGRILQAETAAPVVVGHDVRAGGVAEARLGAGRSTSCFAFVAIGTGIAAAIVTDGRPWTGAHARAGEIGHMVVRPDGEPCACGRRGCLEALGSAAALSRRYAAAAGEHVAAAEVIRRAAAGDEQASAVWQDALSALAEGLVVLQVVADPDVIVIGGGLSMAGPALLEPLRQACRRRAAPADLTVVGSRLGDAAGWKGAALLAWDRAGAGRCP